MIKCASVVFTVILLELISVSVSYAVDIKEVVKGKVWTAETPTTKDPSVKIYFGMERIDNSEQAVAWKSYSDSAKWLTGKSGRGILSALARQSEPGRHPKCDGNIKDYTGFEEAELRALMESMEKLQMYLPKNYEALEGVGGGIAGFSPIIGKYVIYASKKPINGLFKFKNLKEPELQQVSDLKEFQANYEDIIMTMGAWEVPDTPLISHRGIFRNPMDFVDPNKSYSGISLMLHAFSAKALSKAIPEKKFLAVTPTDVMADLLMKKLTSDEMYIQNRWDDKASAKGADGKEIPLTSKIPGFSEYEHKVPGGQFEGNGTFLIKIDALTKLLK
jgi:hypothetical protein